jgi:hypothetical protein
MQRVRMAMSIGREYRVRDIRLRQWQRQAGELRLDPASLIARIDDLGRRMVEQIPVIGAQVKREGIGHQIIDNLGALLTTRIGECRQSLR